MATWVYRVRQSPVIPGSCRAQNLSQFSCQIVGKPRCQRVSAVFRFGWTAVKVFGLRVRKSGVRGQRGNDDGELGATGHGLPRGQPKAGRLGRLIISGFGAVGMGFER